MKKVIFLFISVMLLKTSYIQAQELEISNIFEDNSNNISLTNNERKAIRIIKEWQTGNKVSPVTKGNNGEIELIYGLSQSQILTAILQVTDIQFEENESISSVHLGDTARWVVEHIKGNQEHLIIKPKESGLLTSLVVVTDKRTYHMQIKSNEKLYYPMVKFHYPENLIIKAQNKNYNKVKNISVKDIATGAYLKDLNFNYTIKGNASFKPVRVYNNNIKTIIEMPRNINASNIPILMTLEAESKKPVIVNYRYQNNKFIVDAIFDKAILISGVGMKQKKITIIRGE